VTGRPLVVVTRDEGAEGRLTAALSARGLDVFPLATVAVRPAAGLARLDALLAGSRPTDWLAFTSDRAVEVVCCRAAWKALAPGVRPRIAAVGAATADGLRARAAPPVLVADGTGGLALAAALAAQGDLSGVHVVWPRSDRARPELVERLRGAGARVSEVVAYHIEPVAGAAVAEFRELLVAGRLAAITFLSPSSALGLARALGEGGLGLLAGRTLVASIGPTTSQALLELQAPPQLEAPAASLEALADALAASLTGAKR
jgi:uroporphyrinogen-III synthase